ncbi:DUF1576 domain-containing protein [Carnobacterium gallinarum]|uniref:DUF1576 domain-containing protein n=1 Tax=Carnobacterium gallinarum TaxID=2749 RepID=UPI0005506EBE|nr:DUF1576 domain-containing protein [Carnobacterium gallinarum]
MKGKLAKTSEQVLEKQEGFTKNEVTEDTKYYLLVAFSLSLMMLGFVFQTPGEIWEGMKLIMTSSGKLLTDYMELASIGAAFFNSGLLTLLSVLMVRSQKVSISGPLVAGILTVCGFSLFGKNLFNSIPITLGVVLYAKFEHRPFSHFLLISLFGTALGPVVSELAFGMGFEPVTGILIGYGVGIIIGAILPPLSGHFLSFHKGFSLYNIGFTSGIIGMFITSVIRMFGGTIESASILSSGNNVNMSIVVFSFCLLLFMLGFYYNGKSLSGYPLLLKHSGKLVTDFFLLEGFGKTLINMALQGVIATCYVLLVGGQLNGPIIGGIFTIIGFSAFGKHPRNSIPIFIGVYLASILNIYQPDSTNALLAALFGTTLAPISGYYGSVYGIIAGFMHMALVMNVGYLHGGMNLYNNGFSGGFTAALLVPIYDAILSRKKE